MDKCAICNKEKKRLRRSKVLNGEKICQACYHRVINRKECCICHKVKPVSARVGNDVFCHACHAKNNINFIRKFLGLSDEEAVMLVARGVYEDNFELIENIEDLIGYNRGRERFIEIVKIINNLRHGGKVTAALLYLDKLGILKQLIKKALAA